MSINKAVVSGNLTRDPELRNTAAGTPVLRFGVAVNDRVKNQQTQQWEDRPNFIDCVMFGKRAESVSRFVSKGAKVAIEGRLHWSQWQAQDGSKRSKVEVVVDEIELMQQRQQQPQAQTQQTYQQAPQQPQQGYQQPAMMEVAPSVYDEDIPF